MSENVIALNQQKHSTLKVKQDNTFKHASNQHLCLLQAHEFVLAALEYPIVFIKDTDSDQFIAVAMLGLESNENLFFSPSGWKANHIPATVIGYPLSMGADEQTIYIDMDCDLVNSDEGETLFTNTGEESDFINHFRSNMHTFIEQSLETKIFINYLKEKMLLQPLNLTINTSNGKKDITGVYSIHSEFLQKISDESFIELKNKNYLSPIFAQIMSLNNIAKLIKFKYLSIK